MRGVAYCTPGILEIGSRPEWPSGHSSSSPPTDRNGPAIGCWPSSNVANGWIAEPSSLSPAASLDHGVGTGEERRRDREAERLCGPQIDDELKRFGLFDWEIRRLGTAEYTPDIDAAFAISA
jgi:hypothetical protein